MPSPNAPEEEIFTKTLTMNVETQNDKNQNSTKMIDIPMNLKGYYGCFILII